MDNVYSYYSSLRAITDASVSKEDEIQICFGFDHEEVGSQTYVGADSNYIKFILQKILWSLNIKDKDIDEGIRNSIVLSCDMAHSIHPNFPSYH